jgi:hypothetical protein
MLRRKSLPTVPRRLVDRVKSTHFCLSRGEPNCLGMPCPTRRLATWKLLRYHQCVPGTSTCARVPSSSDVLLGIYTRPITTQRRIIYTDFSKDDHSAPGGYPFKQWRMLLETQSGSPSRVRHTSCSGSTNSLRIYTKIDYPWSTRARSAAEVTTERSAQTQKPVTLMYITTT